MHTHRGRKEKKGLNEFQHTCSPNVASWATKIYLYVSITRHDTTRYLSLACRLRLIAPAASPITVRSFKIDQQATLYIMTDLARFEADLEFLQSLSNPQYLNCDLPLIPSDL
jgi:hypothetical protein